MLQTLKKFFDSAVRTTAECSSPLSGWVWSAPFALPYVFRQPPSSFKALLERNVTMATLWTSLGIIVISLIITIAINMKSTMLQTRAGYRACANKRIEIAGASAVPAYGLVQ